MGMNLLEAGYTLTWNRTASRADELVDAGREAAKSPQEALPAADFLVTMVSDLPPSKKFCGDARPMRR